MYNVGGLAQNKKREFNDISTCIISCEKCIYGINRLNAEMGEIKDTIIMKNIKNLHHGNNGRISLGRGY